MNFNHGKLLKSFGYAFSGLKIVLVSQQNFWIHFVIACLVVAAGTLAGLTTSEWCIITLTIFLVFAMEIVNTAIEKLVDFISPGYQEQAGLVKDISAAAVLVTVFGAVIVGIIIFLPRIL